MGDDHWKSIPVWGGHWSSVCVYVWMYVYGMMCESARLCEGVEEVPVALLLLPLESSPGFLLLLFWSPKWGQVHLCTNTLSFPCWQLSLLFMVTAGMRKGRTHWCEDATWTLLTQKKKHLKVKELSLLCSPILFDWPSFDLNKKGVREPPGGSLWVWRHFSVLLALGVNPRRVEREV